MYIIYTDDKYLWGPKGWKYILNFDNKHKWKIKGNESWQYNRKFKVHHDIRLKIRLCYLINGKAGHLHSSWAVELDSSRTYGQLYLVMVHSQAPSRTPP